MQITHEKDVLTGIKALWLQQMIDGIIDYSINTFFGYLYELGKKCPSHVPGAQGDVLKLPVL